MGWPGRLHTWRGKEGWRLRCSGETSVLQAGMQLRPPLAEKVEWFSFVSVSGYVLL